MAIEQDFPTNRTALIRSLFPSGVPQLWVPTLVFYDEAGRIDRERQFAHLAFMAPYLKGYLVPGSAGECSTLRRPDGLAYYLGIQRRERGRLVSERKSRPKQFSIICDPVHKNIRWN